MRALCVKQGVLICTHDLIALYSILDEAIDFKRLHDARKRFIRQNEGKDHVVITGKNKVLISAPHSVSQVRLGRYKSREIGSLVAALCFQKATGSYLIAKTQNNNDDANFNEVVEYLV